MVTEVMIILLPIIGFYDTLLPMKRRLTVILAFSTRLPYVPRLLAPILKMLVRALISDSCRNIVISLMHLLAYSEFINNKQPPISIVSTVTWQNVLLAYNLMSATIPSLKGFTQGFMTAGVSLGYARDTTTSGGISGTHQSYEMRALSKVRPISKVSLREQEYTESQSHATAVASKDQVQCYHEESASIASHDSRKIMIKREWKVSHSGD